MSSSTSSEEALLLEEVSTYLVRLKSRVRKSTSCPEKLPETVSPRALQVNSRFKLRRLQDECDKSGGGEVSCKCKVLTLRVTEQRGKKSHPYSSPVLSSQQQQSVVAQRLVCDEAPSMKASQSHFAWHTFTPYYRAC